MTEPVSTVSSFKSAWEVLLLFLIPIGGGIPGGVLLAKSRNLSWQVMTVLYFISDVILAFLFEPIMLLAVRIGKRSPGFGRFLQALRASTKKSTAHYGSSMGPLALILVAFGVDPMTGRAIAAASGHGFLTGWMLAITGDMMYFSLLMVSTLFLNNILGDGTWTTVIILAVMMIVPMLVRKFRERSRVAVPEAL
ncbi:MAG: hypothetical protein H7222_08665 [Methylotenera sp.]|nr:hypothetical protein [Oligoflexia bacterium]